jgi:Rrf2 family protein
MLTQTSVTAVRILIHLSREAAGEVVSLKQIAENLDESPTYLVKIARHLVRAGILRAHRGKTGGVVLNRAPENITLLAVVEACQGAVHANFCQDTPDLSKTCAMHQAGAELHNAILGVLTHWTLADFIAQPCPAKELQGNVHCLLQGGRPGLLPSPRKGKR